MFFIPFLCSTVGNRFDQGNELMVIINIIIIIIFYFLYLKDILWSAGFVCAKFVLFYIEDSHQAML